MTIAAPTDAADSGSFEPLIESLLPAGYRLAYAMLRSQPEAEDAIQEAALRAWAARHRLRPGSDPRPWFMTIVANQCRQQRRSRWWSVLRGGWDLPEEVQPAPAVEEKDFRDRFRAAVGEAPDVPGATQRAAALLHRPPPHEERTGPPRAMVLVAGALALLVLAGLLGTRLLRTAPRSTSPASHGAAPAGCRLPMVVTDAHSVAAAPPADPAHDYPSVLPRYTAGFMSPATGRFLADPSAQGGTMPFSRMYVKEQWTPRSYDLVLKRWLPASLQQISPDRLSYLYVVQSPLATGKGASFDASTLHVYDVTSGQDRALWTTSDQIGPDATWEADGIHARTVPQRGGRVGFWLVAPATGVVTQITQTAPAGSLSAAELRTYGMTGGGGFGTDGAGHPILLDGSRNPGAHQEYFVGGPNGHRIVIHSGTMGDSFDFDPNGFTVDGDRLWAANYDATAIWLWTEKGGLQRFALTGVANHDAYVTPRVVGPCL